MENTVDLYDAWHWQYPGVNALIASDLMSIDEAKAAIEAAVAEGDVRGDWGFCWVQPSSDRADSAAAVWRREAVPLPDGL